MTNQPRGFIALISASIISAILLLVATTASLSGFYSRFNILDAELKERSVALAEACVDHAFLQLARDSNYIGNEMVLVGAQPCTIGAVTGSTQKTFKTQGIFNNFYTNFSITVDPATLTVLSWQEIPNP
ncbi:MAG: hypothetical protein G01um101456_521 [Parcubacteria group bacterium Gr01-1014_56]|nr:MAG: hypothetical protein G01um101456_521 [Parcubacteria group bacterium Gr01-1014_56]